MAVYRACVWEAIPQEHWAAVSGLESLPLGEVGLAQPVSGKTGALRSCVYV